MSLEVALSWIMEHALKYDFEELKNELVNLFPDLVHHKLEIPNQDILLILGHLRGFLRGKTTLLENPNDLDNLILDFQNIEKNYPDFVSKPAKRKALLLNFLCHLEQLMDLMDLKGRLENLKHSFNEKVFNEDFLSGSPEKKKIKQDKLLGKDIRTYLRILTKNLINVKYLLDQLRIRIF